MKTTNNTVLVTGGSAGIGLAIAKLLSSKGNHVIITGRDKERLQRAASELQNVTAIQSDMTLEKDVDALVARLKKDFPQLNMVINNAGTGFAYDLGQNSGSYQKGIDEMKLNYFSIVNLNEQLLEVLAQQEEAAIVNVTSIVAIAASNTLPTYSATKAALSSYTKTLRSALAKSTSIKVFELMPPLVNTELTKTIGGENGIAPEVVANDLLDALSTDRYEIRTGATEDIYKLSLSSPEAAFNALNGIEAVA